MIVLIADQFLNVEIIDIQAETTDHIPDEIRMSHSNVLERMGISDNLKQLQDHQEYFSPKWDHNVRIFDVDALYDDEYWDLSIFAIDASKTNSKCTIIFFDVSGEYKIFLSNYLAEEQIFTDVRRNIGNKGFDWSTPDVEEIFSTKWINESFLNYDALNEYSKRIKIIEWNKYYHANEFSLLRCYLIYND